MKFSKYLKVIYLIFFILLSFTQIKAEIKIAVVEMDVVIKQSIAGKSILQSLSKLDKSNKEKYIQLRKKLSEKKEKIISQKDLLSKDEYSKKIKDLNNEFSLFQKDSNEKVNKLRIKRDKAMKEVLIELNKILSEYADKNNLTFIIDQKNIIIGKTDLNITKKIIDLLNNKIKKIKLN